MEKGQWATMATNPEDFTRAAVTARRIVIGDEVTREEARQLARAFIRMRGSISAQLRTMLLKVTEALDVEA